MRDLVCHWILGRLYFSLRRCCLLRVSEKRQIPSAFGIFGMHDAHLLLPPSVFSSVSPFASVMLSRGEIIVCISGDCSDADKSKYSTTILVARMLNSFIYNSKAIDAKPSTMDSAQMLKSVPFPQDNTDKATIWYAPVSFGWGGDACEPLTNACCHDLISSFSNSITWKRT